MATQKPYRPDRAEIVWIQHDHQVKREMKGRHPIMVSSPKAFVERTGLVIGLPLTCSGFNADHSFAVPVVGHGKEVGYILCHQPKSFDWQLRAPLGRCTQAHFATGFGQARCGLRCL